MRHIVSVKCRRKNPFGKVCKHDFIKKVNMYFEVQNMQILHHHLGQWFHFTK